MAYAVIKTSAPGSLMLMGEHAVLHDKTALVMAICERIHITLSPRADDQICIASDLGSYQTSLKNLEFQKPWQFILAICAFYQLHQGFNIEVKSEFSPTLGFGSSAALSAALCAAFRQFLFACQDKEKLLQDVRSIIRKVQGIGSGADAAASIYGGIVHYHQKQNVLSHFKQQLPLYAVYCGYKTPTVEVIAKVNQLIKTQAELCNNLFVKMESLCQTACVALATNDLPFLASLMQAHQLCQKYLEVSDKTLDHLIAICEKSPNILGAKISGSGLGDCIIALGQMPVLFPNLLFPHSQQFAIQTDLQGVCYDVTETICRETACS